MVFELKRRMVYTDNDDGTTVWVIDAKAEKIAGTVSVAGPPEEVKYDPVTDRLYQNIKTTNSVQVIDPVSHTVTATWSTPDTPAAVTDFYRQQLGASDWTVTDWRSLSASTVIYFQSTSVPNREGYLSVSSQPFSRRTNITMTVAKSATGPGPASGCHVLVGAAG